MPLHLYNSLTRKKEQFQPDDPKNIRLYVCGPTVYDRAHLGNARSVVVYDVLYRLLCHLYGKDHVTYVRNITDVDDKINAAAKERRISIQALTKEVTQWFHDDMAALGCLPPTREPRATEHIPQMIAMIEKLIANGNAYVSENHVLFAVTTYKGYGKLSGRVQEELKAGARIEVESYKKHPGDFVLWKPSSKALSLEGRGLGEGDDPQQEPGWDSPWGKGRPGWHIECSAMSTEYLGENFDLHGGGADLKFPHHENEIAQSCCATPGSHFAKTWIHNGFLTVNGEKMSKSLGNFKTVHDLLGNSTGIEQQKIGENIRFALLSAKYNEPLDWNEKLYEDAKKTLDKWYRQLPPTRHPRDSHCHPREGGDPKLAPAFLEALQDDMNLPKAISLMHNSSPEELFVMGKMLGFFAMTKEERFKGVVEAVGSASGTSKAEAVGTSISVGYVNATEENDTLSASATSTHTETSIQNLITARTAAKKSKNWKEADRIREELKAQGILLEDRPDGTTDWRRA